MIEEKRSGLWRPGVRVARRESCFVDPISIRYLTGAEVDFVDTITGRWIHDQESPGDLDLRNCGLQLLGSTNREIGNWGELVRW